MLSLLRIEEKIGIATRQMKVAVAARGSSDTIVKHTKRVITLEHDRLVVAPVGRTS